MTVQAAEAPVTAAERLVAVAAAHQAQQAAQRAKAVSMILAAWATLDTRDMARSWVNDVGQRVYVLLSVVQRTLASDAGPYVRAALEAQGLDLDDLPDVNPDNFAGIASDGRDMESLLAGAVIRARVRIRRRQSTADAMQAGADFLAAVARTQISDAGRAADQVAIIAVEPAPVRRGPSRRRETTTLGWVRMLQPPSCGRCAILAGRFYRWSDGFERHPNCDCRHIPASESVSGDLTTDPKAYFDSLGKAEQDNLFGKANAEAIRAGADIAAVINASSRKNGMFVADGGRRYTTEGTVRGRTRRGRGRANDVLRPTPWQIMKDARGDIEAARSMLREFGYLL